MRSATDSGRVDILCLNAGIGVLGTILTAGRPTGTG